MDDKEIYKLSDKDMFILIEKLSDSLVTDNRRPNNKILYVILAMLALVILYAFYFLNK